MNSIIGERYRIVKKIGTGGMADVYLALDTVLNREVALKVLRGDLSHDPVALLRFQREANAASGLNHQSIVEVYDVGEDEGQHYIVMEMIRGTTLKQLVHRRGALDKYESVAIMQQLASALQHAHAAHVIHRDIKPQNILVKDDGTVKITDFGIALAGDAIQLTKSDSVLGSVHYMAPECSRGEGAGEQSDVYSLGVVFYELLTGDVPYRGETPVEIAMKHMREPFPSVMKFNPTLPNSIANIIARATHKNRTHRYANMKEFVEDLDTCLLESRADEPLWEATMESDDGTKLIEKLNGVTETLPNQQKPKKKRKMIVGASLLAVVIVIFSIWMIFAPKKPSDIEIPDLAGLSVSEAKEHLANLGLNYAPSYLYEISDKYEDGKLIGTKPEKGTKVLKGDQIKLIVSQGKIYTVEDFTGKSVNDVKAILSDKNINIKTTSEYSSSVPTGHIIRQEGLMPGDKIKPEQRYDIVLVVSSDKELVLPGDLIGKSIADAKAQLEGLGVEVTTSELPTQNLSISELNGLSYGTVIRSNPMPGSYYIQNSGNSVTLYYYSESSRPKEEEDEKEEKPSEREDKPDGNNDREA
ncbi:Stk1 family PASTA domain-containing Ser/Thr kinase [Erysipelothrix amsterdamensis]|uniref:non-specific serine/threonine protein kinase n=1 Tax=Erysipelothrix amsterdamensis TaxID=2929157 RepID=A0AAU9VI02_9FIRM|nr:Stk1 family PASTA domain-containing Ser/Thr kinase [Erysipelothrix sp. A18Y020d]CAH2762857.1 Stk1 family PASTA domain-containing Ser/Thr kinase [Erysipelothrix sp. A18Y020d]